MNALGTKRINELRQASIDHTSPPVRVTCKEVPCINGQGIPDVLLVFRVDPGERVHEMKNGDTYLRVGDESRKLNFTQRQELEFDKGQSQYDGTPAGSCAPALHQHAVPLTAAELLRGIRRGGHGAERCGTSAVQREIGDRRASNGDM